ncbi:MAG TPA: ATP-binding cassette domain-containing protein, partial [Gammaproteobacteria bacterium]|nr:ATP-binding cassette domain-containing protein [Gammaproteobacteria bacterium]
MVDSMLDGSPLVEIRGLRFGYSGRTIFDDVDIDIQRGKVTAIMGPSGTGKTTLLRLMGGQERPSAGTIRIDGVNVPDLSRKNLYQLRKRMGM